MSGGRPPAARAAARDRHRVGVAPTSLTELGEAPFSSGGAPRASDALISGPLAPAILGLAGPAVGTTLFQVLFNVTDTFWIGRTLGGTALAAVAAASYSVWIITSFGELVGVGLTAVAARRHGEGHPHAAARATGTALILSVVLGIAVGVAGSFALDPMLRAMRVGPDVAAAAREFLLVQLHGAVSIYGYYVVAAAFRSAGDTRTPFLLLAGSVLLNVVLDPVLILGLGPVPPLGVYGAALATVATRGLAFAAGLVLLARRGSLVLGFQPTTAATIVRIGTPTMVAGTLFSLIYISLATITGSFGAPALAALGLGHKIEGVSYMVCVGFGLAAETVVGQNLGAAQPDRARRAGWLTVRFAATFTGVCGVAFLLVPEALAGIFTSDPAVIEATAGYLRAIAIAQLATAVESVLEGALSGAGYTLWTMFWIVVLSAVRIPLAVWVAPRYGLTGIWWIISVTGMLRALALAILWRRGAWQRARA